MIDVDVDSDVDRVTKRAIKELSDLDSLMDEVAKDAADYLVQNDPYQNRTGDLRSSTQAETQRFGDNEVETILAMGMYYASFVINLGYSNWDLAVEDMRRDMDQAIDALARRVTRGL